MMWSAGVKKTVYDVSLGVEPGVAHPIKISETNSVNVNFENSPTILLPDSRRFREILAWIVVLYYLQRACVHATTTGSPSPSAWVKLAIWTRHKWVLIGTLPPPNNFSSDFASRFIVPSQSQSRIFLPFSFLGSLSKRR